MATPTVFVSSTFYDLKYARESMKRFIEQLGYTPVLSEDGAVYFDPKVTAAEACLQEIGNVDLFVLLIGGRYGSQMPDGALSVTNAEFEKAAQLGVPIFAVVEQGTYSDYNLFRHNRHQPDVLAQLDFPNADDVRIFEFIESVTSRAANNALVPFTTITDIEHYLQAQWAGMMRDFLAQKAAQANVSSTLDVLKTMNTRVELIADQILRNVGTPLDRIYVTLQQAMIESPVTSDLRTIGGRPRPGQILEASDVSEAARAAGSELFIDSSFDEEANIISGGGGVTESRMRDMKRSFEKLKSVLLGIVDDADLKVEDIRAYEMQIGTR